MKTQRLNFVSLAVALAASMLAGCSSSSSQQGITNPSQPGPAIGRGAGAVVGSVAGNTAGAVVGFGEGFTAAASKSFEKKDTRILRRWHTETTADGRIIQVPEDIVVDEYGRPIDAPAKKSEQKP